MPQLDQPALAFTDGGGRTLPLMRTKSGGTKTITTSTSPNAELQIHNNTYATPIRLWSIGQQHRYVFGATGVAAPAATDGFIDAGAYIETYMLESEKYIRAASVTGAGSLVIEVLT